jgi:type IV pilus assembly protein PilW
MSRQIKLHRKAGKQKGYTLVELMVAMVIGLILTAGILQLFVSNKQTYRVTENMSRLQENGRFAMFFLANDIRMADYWGCRSQGISIENNLNANPNFDLPISALAGFNNDSAANSIINGTDTITVKGVSSSNVFLVNIPANPSANLKVTDNSGLQQNDIVLVSDCTDGDIFQITNDPSTGAAAGQDNVVHNTGAVSSGPGNIEKPLKKKYDTDAQVYKLNFATYSIQNGAGGQNALFRSINGGTAQELVEGIENMQILYGEDTDGDGAANYYKAAGAAVNMDNVVSVRISLVAVTLENNITDQANPITVFGSSYTPPTVDKRIRRVFTSTIVIRNRLP